MVTLLNGLEASADEVFCDVVDKSMERRTADLDKKMEALPLDEKQDILDLLERLIKQAERRAEKNGTLKKVDDPPKT